MKEGVSKSLETLSEIGGKVQEEALKAGYGPTIRADAVKKLVELRRQLPGARAADHRGDAQAVDPELSEIRDAVEDGKRRMAEAGRRRQSAAALMSTARFRDRCGMHAAAVPATLDDVMLAMDVVDTLRHRERLVERELNEDMREEQLIERLRELYKSQGIDVPDRIIDEGRQGAQGEPLRLYAARAELRPYAGDAVGQAHDLRQMGRRYAGGARGRHRPLSIHGRSATRAGGRGRTRRAYANSAA